MPTTRDAELAALGERLVFHRRHHPGALQLYVDALDPENRNVVERAIALVTREGWRASPLSMALKLDGNIKPWEYIKLLSDKFVDAVRGTSNRQIWNLPARYGKSLFGSQWGPVWALDQDPTTKLALTSYGDLLATENALGVRNRLIQYGDVLDVTLRLDRRAGDRFVTDQNGGLIAAGIGSALTGFGAHGLVIDDPFKNWQEAHSEARRLAVWNWYRSVARLRLESNDAWIIVIMTRWHEDDLTGKLLAEQDDGEDWELIRLPALAEDDDLLGRARGEPLEPDRFDLDACLARARALGSYLTAGMEQQRPSPEEGGEIKRAWWKWYTDHPPRYDECIASWDCKLKDTETGDYVVGQVWGRTGSDFWGIDQIRGQFNFATTKAAVALLKVRHTYIDRIIVENKGNGPEVMKELRRAQPDYVLHADVRSALGMTDDEVERVERLMRRGMTGILPENPIGDKKVRARAQSPIVESGHAHLPEHAAWAAAFVNECAAFPNGRDDMVDTWSQAFKRLSGGGTTSSVPQGSIKTPKPGARSMPKNAGGIGRAIRPTARVLRKPTTPRR